jgi:flagellar basal body-associated protein FliL
MRKQSTTQTVIFISIVVVVVAALMLIIGSGGKSSPTSTKVTPKAPSTPIVQNVPALTPEQVDQNKKKVMSLVTSGKKLTESQKKEIYAVFSGTNFYYFSEAEQKLVLAALTK